MRLKTLNTDVSPINQPEGTYRDARNMVLSSKYGSIINEDGFQYLYDLPVQPIGVVPINDDEAVVFCTNPLTNEDEIGLINGSSYTRILLTTSSTDRLNLDINYPVKGRFRISNRGHRIIAFTDNLNPPRVINIDQLPFPVNGSKVPTQPGSIATLSLFSAGDPPTIDFSLNQSGGTLKTGAYLFSTAYVLNDGSELGYTTVIGTVKINDETATNALVYDGAVGGTITSKSITITLSNVDTRYKALNIAVLSTIAGETSFKKVGRIEIISGLTIYTFTYSGNETTEELLLEEATVQSQGLYNKAKAIAVINDQLALGNLSAREPYPYQEYANQIVVNWTLDGVYNAASTTSVVNASNLQSAGFRCFEVYAFYIAFRYKDGSYSPAYHIPGRQALAGDTNNSALMTAKKFQVEDTCLTDGTMSYWENMNETYPTDFPDFGGQKVRHHKFPSLNFIMTNAAALGQPTLATRMGLDLMPIIGVEFSAITIPVDLQSEIDGYQIFFAKRDIQNQTCVGQGHLIFAHQNKNNSSLFSPNPDIYNGMYNAENLQSKPAISKLSFHSPDLILNKPSIAPSYVRNEIKLFARIDSSYSGSATSNADPIIELRTDDAGNGPRQMYKILNYLYTTSNTGASASVSGDLIRTVSVTSPLYVAPNVVNGDHFNLQSSEYIHLDIASASTLTIAANLTGGSANNLQSSSAIAVARRREDTYLSNLCQLITTVYPGFTNQTLVACTNVIESIFNITDTVSGDNYLADYSFVSTQFKESSYGNNDTTFDPAIDTTIRGNKTIRHYVCECNINIKFRHEALDDNSKFYAKSSYKINNTVDLQNSFLSTWDVNKGQILEYNTDYSVVNTFNPVFPYDSTVDTITRFPYRVVLSEKTSNELADSGWRTFLPNNYRDVSANKGEITNLEVMDDILFIHVEHTLFRTVSTQRLKTETEDVTIGIGDIFDIPPKEILTSEMGYLGNQNLIGCGVTKLGYTFIDVDQGKMFIVGKDIKEISSLGLRNFFRDNLTQNPVADNPFTTTGISIAYDEKYNRLLATKKGTNSFTLSYSPDMEGFVSYHDYIPSYMFNTRNKVFSFDGVQVYLHNHTNKATYYDGIVYPSYIETVFSNTETVHFSNMQWQSEVIKPDNTSLFHSTFTEILLYNSYQCSGNISLSYPANIFNSETTWNFNKFYDIVVNRALPFINSNGLIPSNLSTSLAWFKQRRFVDKWLAVRFSYNNTDQNTLLLYDVDALMRQSGR